MRKWFKLLAIAVALCMLFEQVVLAAAAPNPLASVDKIPLTMGTITGSFSDVKDHWCKEIIEKFAKKGWVEGYQDGSFKPDKLVGRAEFTAMVVRILKKLDGKQQCSFKDVKSNDWFYSAVASASKEKYIEGYQDETFRPLQSMSRQEVAVFVKRLLSVVKLDSGKSINFKDEEEIASWAAESITALTSNNVISGYPDGNFKPLRFTTRAEAVKMLDVTLKIIEEGIPGAGDINKPDTPKSETSKPETPTKSAVTTGGGGSSGGSSSGGGNTTVSSQVTPPEADFEIQDTYLRDASKSSNASIELKDKSKPNGFTINQRIWKVRYDSNNDGKFEDEQWEIVDNKNKTAPVYTANKVGRYQAELQVTRGTNYDTDAANNKNEKTKTFTVDNTEPKASFDIQKKKKLDMVVTIGKADSSKINTLSSKMEDFKKICLSNGIDAKIISTSVQSLTASDSFDWKEYDHYNYKDYITLPKHITVTGSSIKMIGYNVRPLKDFLFVPDENKTQKTFTFDLIRDGTNWHSMEGGGFLFNSSIADGKLSGFCILVTQNGLILDEINGVDIQKFRDGSYEYVQNAGRQLGTYNIGDVYIKHSFKIVVDPSSISVWDNNKLIIDNYSLPDKNFGSGFGPIISHKSHDCNQMSYFTFTNILMTTVVGKSLSEVLDKPDWRPNSERILVNLSDDSVYDLLTDDKVADVSCKLLKNSVKFIGLSTDKSKPQYDSVITGTAQNGICIDGTDIDAAISGMEDYILGKVNSKDYTVSDKITTDDEITYSEKYADPENDPEYSKQWKYIHDPSVFQNDNGKAAFDGSLLNSPVAAFDKVGKYDISLRAQDNPVGNNFEDFRKWSDEKLSTRTISVSRKPLVQLKAYVTKDSSGNFITHVIENSYDLDHKSDSDAGIVSKEYSWKNVKDEQWTSGTLPDQLPKDGNYLLKLVVKDKDDAYSDPAVELLSTDSKSSLIPKVTSFPVSSGKEGDPYTYTVTAASAEGDKLTYALTNSPKGMTIDSSTGVIKWNPTGEQSGVSLVSVKITDAKGRSSTQSFTIDVEEAVNSTPVITSTPITAGKEGEAYLYNLAVTDADNDPLQISINQAPSGM